LTSLTAVISRLFAVLPYLAAFGVLSSGTGSGALFGRSRRGTLSAFCIPSLSTRTRPTFPRHRRKYRNLWRWGTRSYSSDASNAVCKHECTYLAEISFTNGGDYTQGLWECQQ